MWVLGGLLILAGLWSLIPSLHTIPLVGDLILPIAAVVAGVLILIDW
jgi:hypothetical protein